MADDVELLRLVGGSRSMGASGFCGRLMGKTRVGVRFRVRVRVKLGAARVWTNESEVS